MGLKQNKSLGSASSTTIPLPKGRRSSAQRGRNVVREILGTKKDTVVITKGSTGIILQYLPELFTQGRRKNKDKVLLIVPSPRILARIEDQIRELSRTQPQAPRAFSLGLEENPRKESRLLLNPRDILVGTPERIIDHLRRDNMDLLGTSLVIIHCPSGQGLESFSADVRFIYSRTGFKPRSLLVIPEEKEDYRELRALLHRPRSFQLPPSPPPLGFYLVPEGQKIEGLQRILLAEQEGEDRTFRILWSGEREEVREMLQKLFSPEDWKKPLPKSRPRIQVEKPSRRAGPPGEGEIIIYNTIPPQEVFDQIRQGFRDCEFPGHFIIIIYERERTALLKAGESSDVYIEERKVPKNDDTIRNLLEKVVQKIKEEEDPEELNYYRKLFTKNVSVFLRSYVAAYLIKQHIHSSGRPRRSRSSKTYTQPGMTTLFFGAGKNRGLGPRDISNLVSKHSDEVEPWEIGEMKILDKYSFVDVVEEKAPLVIEAVNGVNFGGKKLLVNYARKRGSRSRS